MPASAKSPNPPALTCRRTTACRQLSSGAPTPADDDRIALHDVTPPPVPAIAPRDRRADADRRRPRPRCSARSRRCARCSSIRELRPGQAEIIESVLAGRDTLAVMPTGSGKSLTYQLPALVLDGPTLVVSPLLALIEDQFNKLKAAGVAIVRIDSTRTAKERAADLAPVREGTVKLVMITPESVNSPTTARGAGGREVLAVLRRRGALRVAVGPRLPAVVPRAAPRRRGAGAAADPRPDRDRDARDRATTCSSSWG